MKLPMVPPTNPPVYVGPLRTGSSSVNSTVDTTNCMGCGRTGERSCRPPARARGVLGSQPPHALVSSVKAFAVGGWRVLGGRRGRRSVTGSERHADRGLAVRDRSLSPPPRVRMTASLHLDHARRLAVICRVLSRIAACGGRLHSSDDAQAELRDADVRRRAVAVRRAPGCWFATNTITVSQPARRLYFVRGPETPDRAVATIRRSCPAS